MLRSFVRTISVNSLNHRLLHDREMVCAKNALQSHPIYQAVNNKRAIQIFMTHHVFAVFDFMTLLKRLQRDLTCVGTIWTPVANTKIARHINSIVLGEETDQFHTQVQKLDRTEICTSHYHLYLRAMKEVGADTTPIKSFVENLSKNAKNGKENLPNTLRVLKHSKISEGTKDFVRHTLDTAVNSPLPMVASSFFCGREDPIPQMFAKFLEQLPESDRYQNFRMYLDRHIEVDKDDHGPLALELLQEVSDNGKYNQMIIDAGIDAIQQRIKLWDHILFMICK